MFVRSNISYNNGLSILKSCVSYNNCIGLSTILENLFHIFFSYDLKHLQIHCSSIKIILFLFLKHLRHCFIMQSFFTGCHFLYCLWILLMEILIFHNGPVFCKPLFFISIQQYSSKYSYCTFQVSSNVSIHILKTLIILPALYSICILGSILLVDLTGKFTLFLA